MNFKKALTFLPVLLILLTLAGCSGPEKGPPFLLTCITVGKGDAFLLETPGGNTYLIDTGKAQDYVQIARTLRVKEIDCLNGIFVTHGHKDHAGGLQTLLEAFPTETVYYWEEDTISYEEIFPEEFVSRYGATLYSPSSGEILDLGGVAAEVFLPPVPDMEEGNNNSLILMLTHGENRFLMMGDAELPEEALLMDSGMDLKADFLKLGHHGEEDASSPAFLNRVSPEIGFIAGSEEENPDSMDPQMAERLKKRNIQVLYSQCAGLGYEIRSDGKDLSLEILKDQSLPKDLELCFSQVDRKGQRVTIRNDGKQDADLSGCLLRSVKHDELYLFPEGTLLEPGKTISVACPGMEQPGDLVWPREDVWQKKDKARLYDRNLNLLDENKP